jgi:hypothetical protein
MPINPPDKLRLLDALLEVLDVAQQHGADAAKSYEARIALSLLRLVRREIELADELLSEEQARLVTLLGVGGSVTALNATLCERIHRRQIDIGEPRLLHHLRRTTLAKLSIDNPRYSAYLRAVRRATNGGASA